ncbi:MAG: response regulator transcription factor, partial [Albidovulum sp.]
MKILVVDDDPRLRELLTIALERVGYAVITAQDGQRALTHATREAPDLIVLDIGLPEVDGLEVCRRLRARSEVPIIFLTAHDDEVDRIVGLELGADDYVTKPFSPRELVARIRAVLKRAGGTVGLDSRRHGILVLTPAEHQCRVGETEVPLTATEMRILDHLMRRPGVAINRSQLVDGVWGAGSDLS